MKNIDGIHRIPDITYVMCYVERVQIRILGEVPDGIPGGNPDF